MESNRIPYVRPDHAELARVALEQPSGGCQPDWGNRHKTGLTIRPNLMEACILSESRSRTTRGWVDYVRVPMGKGLINDG